MQADTAILSVRQLTEQLRGVLEGKFSFVWVRGEVSNLSRPSSGHIYFSLKDEEAQLQCAWFRQKQQLPRQSFDPLTGEVRDPSLPSPMDMLRNGLDVLCSGSIAVYAARGQYQLIVEYVQPAGEGQLALAFAASREKLAAQGYFRVDRKRALPVDPHRVALITSPTGAALHDFMELASVRGSAARIRLFPVLVQGEGAAPSLIRALEEANAQGWAQVVVLIRGGGSLEDLWAFNEESVADAVFRSRLPVLAGIGHEIDVTLADMTADVRAATPSHAAQLLWPLRAELLQRTDAVAAALRRAVVRRLENAQDALVRRENALRWLSPMRQHARFAERLALLWRALERAASQWRNGREAELYRLEAALTAVPFQARLEALAGCLQMALVRMEETLPRLLSRRVQQLDAVKQRLDVAGRQVLTQREHFLENLQLQLRSSDPLLPLRRGYALASTVGGRLLRSVEGVEPGMAVEVRLGDGTLVTVVSHVRAESVEEGEC